MHAVRIGAFPLGRFLAMLYGIELKHIPPAEMVPQDAPKVVGTSRGKDSLEAVT